MRLIKNCLMIAGSGVLFLAIQGCDLLKPGLGDKVDITPPVLSVSPLSSDNKIPYKKGNVVLTGDVSDDLSISQVTIAYTGKGGAQSSTVATGSGGWTITIPSGVTNSSDPSYAASLPEGEQQLTVTATDKSGKNAATQVTVYIDNSSPTVMMTSPTIYSNSVPANVSQWSGAIDVKGEAYDASPITQVWVKLLTAGGVVKSEGAADGTANWSKRFDFSTVGAMTDGGTYFLDVTVTDKAGNVSTHYYHRADLNAIKDTSALFPAMDEIGKLEQAGTGSIPAGIDNTELATIHLGADSGSTPSYANFKYIASAIPSIYFNNLSTAGGTANTLGLGSVISGNILPPASSQDQIDSTKVTVEYYTAAASLITTISPTVNASNLSLLTIGNSVGFTVSTKNGGADLGPGQYYVKVIATTTANVSTFAYIDFYIDSAAPTLTETNVGVGAVNKAAAFTFAGNAAATIGLSKIDILQSKDGGVDTPVETIPLSGTSASWASSSLPTPTADGGYNYTITLTSTSGKTSTIYRSIIYDTSGPAMSVTQLSPVVGAATYNGLVTVSIAASDANGVQAVRWWVQDSAVAAPTWSTGGYTEKTAPPYSGTIDTETYSNGAYKLWVIGQDKAGNQSIISQAMTIDQTTDYPAVALNNMSVAYASGPALATAIAAGTAGNNLIQTSITLQGTITDDDDVDGGSVQINIDGGGYVAVSGQPANGKSVNFTHALGSISEGTHSYLLQVADLAASKNGKPTITKTLGPIFFAYDASAPVIANPSLGTGAQYRGASFAVTADLSDNIALSNISVTQKRGSGAVVSVITNQPVAGLTGTLNLTGFPRDPAAIGTSLPLGTQPEKDAAADVYEYGITLTDMSGRQSVLVRTVTFDVTPPTISIGSVTPLVSTNTVNGNITLNAIASDANGIESVRYWARKTSDPAVTAYGDAGSLGEVLSGNLNAVIDTEALTDLTDYKLWIAAKDKAGNVQIVAYDIHVDQSTDAPILASLNMDTTVNSPGALSTALGDPIKRVLQLHGDGGAAVVINGTLTDDDSIDGSQLQISVDGGAYAAVSPAPANGKTVNFSYTFSGPGATEGVHRYSIKLNDLVSAKNGKPVNTTTVGPVYFAIDSAVPAVTVTTASDQWKNASFAMNGTASDTYGLTDVWVTLDGGTAVSALSGGLLTGSQPFAWNPAASLFDGTAEGTHTVLVKAVDSFGKSNTTSFTFKVDTKINAPAFTSPASAAYVNGSSVTILGTASDVGGGSSIASVYFYQGASAPAGIAGWTAASGTGTWNTSLSGLAEGPVTLWARAVDIAGNQSTAVSTTFTMDQSDPTVSYTGWNVGTNYRNATYSLVADLGDNFDLASVTVTQKKGAGTALVVANALDLSATTNTTVNLNLAGFPRDPANTAASLPLSTPAEKAAASDTYEYEITVTDAAGRTKSLARTISVDMASPTAAFASVSPLVGGTTANGILNLSVSASDASGIQTVRRWVLPAIDPQPTWATAGSTDWTSGPYTATYDTTSVSDGLFKIWVIAQDKAGNETAISQSIIIDQTSDLPQIVVSSMDFTKNNSGLASANMVESTAKISVTVSDDDLVQASSIQILVDDVGATGVGTYATVSSSPVTDSLSVSFEHDFGSGLIDGIHWAWIQVTDQTSAKSGKAAVTKTFGPVYFVRDSAPPNLAIVSPAQNLLTTGPTITLSGTASDSNGLGNSSTVTVRDITGAPAVLGTPTVDGSGNWSQSVNVTAAGSDGTKTLEVVAVDIYGKSTTAQYVYKRDQTLPVATIDTAKPTAGAWLSGSAYTATGTATDTNTIVSVEYSLDGTTWNPASGTNSWNVSLNLAAIGEGNKTLSIRATDSAGNLSTVATRAFGIDQTAPSGAETALGTREAINAGFTLGGTAADTNGLAQVSLVEKKNGVVTGYTWSTTLSGTSSSWNSPSLPSGGLVDATYDYTVTITDVANNSLPITRSVILDQTAPPTPVITEPTANTAFGDGVFQVKGTEAVDTGSGLDLVQWAWTNSATDSDWTNATGSSSWTMNIDTASVVPAGEGNKTVWIRALDKAGNKSTTSRAIWYDKIAPTASIDSPTSTYKTNGTTALAVVASAGDANGIASVLLKFDDTNFGSGTTATTLNGVSGKYEATVAAATVAALANGNHTLYSLTTDNAGRTVQSSVAFFVDTVAPTIAVTSHTANATVNKTLTFLGTANDNFALALSNIQLSIQKADTSWQVLGTPLGSAGSWNYAGIDTQTYGVAGYDIDSGTAGVQIKIRATATDAAGNTTNTDTVLNVDQNSDRPVVKLTNLHKVPDILKLTTTIYGTVTDDDGAIASIQVKNAPDDGTGWVTVNLSGGTFSYDVLGDDGTKDLYVQVTDAAGTTFDSSNGTTLTQPLFQYTDNFSVLQSVNGVFNFKLDTIAPEVANDVYIDTTTATAFDSLSILTPGTSLGGTGATGQFFLRIEAKDANAIAAVKVDVKGKDKAAPTVDKTVTSVFAVNGSATPVNTGFAVWDSPSGTAVDITGLADGNASLVVTVTDGSGLKTTVTKSLFVDNTAPTVGVIGPATASVVFGDVTITGFANDAIAGVQSVKYKVGSGAWTDVSGSLFNWQIPFTGSNSINNFANATYATDDGNGVWTFPIQLQVTDKAGNVDTKSDYAVKIDPSGDKPQITIAYPTGSSPLGGQVRVVGSASDNNAVYAVFMQIDVNNDGVYDTSDQANGVNWYNNGYGQQVTGQNSWYQNINAAGEFNPVTGTRTINVRVRAQDTKNGSSGDVYGPWSSTTITFDNKVPRIGSTTALYLDNNTVQKPFVPGMSITGNWTLKGSVETDNAISDIQVSGDVSGTLAGNPSWFSLVTVADSGFTSLGSGYKRIDLQVPITTTANSYYTVNLTVKALDVQSPIREASQQIGLQVDNKAPTAAVGILVKNGSATLSSSTSLTDSTLIGNGSVAIGQTIMVNGTVTTISSWNSATGAVGFGTAVTGTTAVYSILATNFPVINSNGSFKISGMANDDSTTSTNNVVVYLVRRHVNSAFNDRFYSASSFVGTNVKTDVTGSDSLTVSNGTFTYPSSASYRINLDNKLEYAAGDKDNDGYVEDIEGKLGTSYYWSVDLDSTKIPDGPIEIHYVVYDTAGNATHYQLNTTIQNSGPTVKKMYLGTDLDGNGSVDTGGASTEYLGYTLALSAGQYGATTGFTGKAFPMLVTPDALAGNGDLYYRLKYGPTGSTLIKSGTLRTSGVITPITLTSGDLTNLGGDSATANDKHIIVEVWDSTEETIVYTDSLNVSPWVDLTLKTIDTVIPKSVISPFYWTSATDNSLYANSRNNGHIELVGVSGDTDPNISGKVSVRGTAYDDNRITALYLWIGNSGDTTSRFAFTSNLGTKVFGSQTYAKVATYSAGTWTGVGGGNFATNGWQFSAATASIGQTGHRVTWQLDWDSSKISGVAVKDNNIRLIAEDAAGTPNASAITINSVPGDDTLNNVPKYQVDVVPYITGLTRDSSYNTIRSKQGRGAFRRGENLTVAGFNLYNSASDTVTVGASGSITVPGSSTTSFTVAVPAAATSGDVTLTVNGVSGINNLDDNTKEWNKENTATTGTELWTDDRKIHVWQSDANQTTSDFGYFTGSANPVYPAMTYNSGVLYGSWSNYASSNILLGQNNNTTTTTAFHAYDPSEHTDIAYGALPTIVYNANIYGNNTWNQAGAGGIQIYDANAPTNSDGSGNYPAYDMEELFHNQLLMQFINPRVAAYNTDIHVSYHDTKDKSLKYAYQLSGGDAASNEHQTWINIDGGSDSDDTSPLATTNYTQAGTTTSVTYVSSTTATNVLATVTGSVNQLNGGGVGTSYAAGANILRQTPGNVFVTSPSAAYLVSRVANGTATTSGVTVVATIQPNTTISTLPVAVGGAVTAGTVIATMANGTSITAGTAGYIATLPVAVGGTVVHNTTVIATITDKKVGTVSKAVNDVVAIGDLLLTMADGTQVTATSAGTVTAILAANTNVGTSPTTVATTTASRVVSSANRTASAGEYSAIDLTPTTHYPVIAYYDMTGQTVKIAHAAKTNPSTGSDWKVQYVMSAGDTNYQFSGKYISMKIDSAGYLHLVFYRNSTGDLIYMKSTNAPTNGTTDYTFGSSVIIDSIGAVGIWADITLDGTTPYISYLDSSYTNTFDGVKMAYYDTSLGDWETMNVPLNYEVESVRTSIEIDTGTTKFWKAAIGYASSDYYRLTYYVK